MSEKQPPIEKQRSELPIEQQANFEGSWTNLMCERLRNPEIRKQVIDFHCFEEQMAKGKKNGGDWKTNSLGEVEKDENGVGIFIYKYYEPKTREQLEEKFNERLEMVGRDTPISLKGNASPERDNDEDGKEGREIIYLEWLYEGKKPTDKIWSISEAHEKGHVVRRYSESNYDVHSRANIFYLGEKFFKAFDFSLVDFSDEFYKQYRKGVPAGIANLPNSKIREVLLEYLITPDELAERMSQLKNYFGINGNEKFTKEHLAYAREHYIKDTEFDNYMSQFFQAITPEKEDAFIELINSAGI